MVCVCVCASTYNPHGLLCIAVESVAVLEEGPGATTAHTPSDWLESEEFEPVTSDPIFISAKFTKTPPPGTLSRVGGQHVPTASSTSKHHITYTIA